MNKILEIRNMTKTYPGVVALNNVSLDVNRGECLALVGENGAGKSTLIKAITGALKPDGGTIVFEGKEYSSMSPDLSKSVGIAAIYQEFVLCSPLTVAENIFLGQRWNQGIFADETLMRKKAQEILDRLHTNFRATALVRDLPVAGKQMVEISKAIARDAKLIIMDEPTAPLTDDEVEILFHIIDDLKKNGITIIYISHRLDELYRVADRVTIMRDGETITTKSINELTKDQIISYMVGRQLKKVDYKTCTTDEVLFETKNLGGNGVQPFSLTLHKGEILGLAGLVGAGRTEYAQLIFGAVPNTSGEIYLSGKKVEINSPYDAINHGIGMVTEDRKNTGVLLRMSIKENIVLPILKKISHKGIINKEKEKETTNRQVESLDIKTPSIQQLVGNLSGGNQQKVALAKWLANDSQVLILDEPTRGIDVGAKQEIYKLIHDLAAQGKGIILISSDMEEVVNITDRILILYEGKLMGAMERAEYTQEHILQYASGLTK